MKWLIAKIMSIKSVLFKEEWQRQKPERRALQRTCRGALQERRPDAQASKRVAHVESSRTA